jgi:amino acid transporter
MKQTLSFLFILALCALSWAAIGYGAALLVRWLGWTLAASIIATAVLCVVGLFAREIRNSVDAGD